MKVYTYSRARQHLAALLEDASRDGRVEIRRQDGRSYVVTSMAAPAKSPFPNVTRRRASVTASELMHVLREEGNVRGARAVQAAISGETLDEGTTGSEAGEERRIPSPQTAIQAPAASRKSEHRASAPASDQTGSREAGSLADQLRFAITHKRLIEVRYDGSVRVAEPHDYGVQNGRERLLAYQLRGPARASRKNPVGWRLLDVDKIEEVVVLQQAFPGSRGGAHRQHLVWDILLARVA